MRRAICTQGSRPGLLVHPTYRETNLCSHSDQERKLRGTWCTRKLVRAAEKDYTILKIHEVWHFLAENQVTGLFADCVNIWLKIKQESAGWPEHSTIPESKAEYIQQYKEPEGIHLENVHRKTLDGKPLPN